MRVGCLGCLTSLFAAVILVGLFAAGAWAVIRTSQPPEVQIVAGTPADGARAQQRLYEISRGRRGRGGAEIALTERDLNAFLSRHLAGVSGVPLHGPGIRLVGGELVEFVAQIPLRHLVQEPPLSTIAEALPASWLERPVWIHLRARARLERGAAESGRRYLRFDVEGFAVGRQPLPVMLLRQLLSPTALGMLRWPLPEAVEGVTVERGRAVVRVASGR